jgi:hypothetical protein
VSRAGAPEACCPRKVVCFPTDPTAIPVRPWCLCSTMFHILFMMLQEAAAPAAAAAAGSITDTYNATQVRAPRWVAHAHSCCCAPLLACAVRAST